LTAGLTSPIGVFDSGVGGLTVLRALREAMPGEDFVYLGDTARLPYGTKSAHTVVRYSLQCAAALVARGIRCLVVACNTASASSLHELRGHYPTLPIIGVIEPGAEAAVAASTSQHIAVIGTEGTINGGAYQAAIHRLNSSARVVASACPLFVALAEEGWVEGPIVESIARQYLTPLFSESEALADGAANPATLVTDTLVLGCTHFPVLAAAIRAVLPPHVRVVDSAVTTAAAVKRLMQGADVANHGAPAAPGRVTWLATDGAARFARVGSTFLGEPLAPQAIEIVDL
jgi:glutamate racemase